MNDEIPYYYRSLDWDKLVADYPPPPHYGRTIGAMSAEGIRRLQNERFLERMREAWNLPFYRRHWGAAGLEPGDIRGLDDLEKLPTFNSDDLKLAIEAAPPFGDHHPARREMFGRIPLKIQTSGGTTGMPRVTLFDPLSWEMEGIQTARGLYAQGARPGDVIQIPFTTSLANAGWTAYNAAFHWLGCVPVTTGSGKVTPSERQLEFARAWGANGWYAWSNYLGRLVEVAGQTGFDLHQLPTRYLMTFLGPDEDGTMRRGLEEAWGAPVYDNYGSHEVGLVAWECKHQNGKHINEDTAYIEVCDAEGKRLPDGEPGSVVVTSLFRSVPPFIRYDLRDRMALYPHAKCECGVCSGKLSALLGRIDEMVKLRGTNVYPMSCQGAVSKDQRTTGEFLCVVSSTGEGVASRDEMTIRVERRSASVDKEALAASLAAVLSSELGAKVDVEVVEPGALDEYSKSGEKPRRLLDLRKKQTVRRG